LCSCCSVSAAPRRRADDTPLPISRTAGRGERLHRAGVIKNNTWRPTSSAPISTRSRWTSVSRSSTRPAPCGTPSPPARAPPQRRVGKTVTVGTAGTAELHEDSHHAERGGNATTVLRNGSGRVVATSRTSSAPRWSPTSCTRSRTRPSPRSRALAGPAAAHQTAVARRLDETTLNGPRPGGRARLVAPAAPASPTRRSRPSVTACGAGGRPRARRHQERRDRDGRHLYQLAPAAVDVGFEVFNQAGVRANQVSTGNGAILAVGPGHTVTIATRRYGGPSRGRGDHARGAGDGARQRSGRVVATDIRLACNAFTVDSLHTVQSPGKCPTCSPRRSPTSAVVHCAPAAPSTAPCPATPLAACRKPTTRGDPWCC